MAGPLLPFVTSQILANLRPHAPEGIAQFLPRRGLGEDVVRGIGALGNAIRGEPQNYNLPTDYSVGPQGEVFSSIGDRMVTGQGVSSFQPENQYGISSFEEPRYEPPVPWNYSLSDAANIPSQIPMDTPAQEFPPQRTYRWEPDLGGLDTGSGSVPLPPAISSTRPAHLPPDVPWPPPPGAGGGFMPAGYGAEQSLPGPVNAPDVYRGQFSDLSMGLPSGMPSVAPPAESVDQELERLAARYAEQSQPPAEEEESSDGGAAWWPQAPQVDPRFLQRQQSQQL